MSAKMPSLLIISHTRHYEVEGQIVGFAPTVREIDYLTQVFDTIRHIAFLHDIPIPPNVLPYQSEHITLIAVPPSGGNTILSKLNILRMIPLYIRTIWRELNMADAVHVRCPSNISLIAIVLLALRCHPRLRWVKYAGNWKPDQPGAWSYRFQRWWLRRGFHGGFVTVNGNWSDSLAFVRSFVNPCLTETQVEKGKRVASNKTLNQPVRIIFVGRIEAAKGVGRILEIAEQLRDAGAVFKIDLIGDGSEREEYETVVQEAGLTDFVEFVGWLPRDQVDTFYERAHLILFPSSASEGWPKVLSEAMAFGVVPVASNVSSIPHFLEGYGVSQTYPPDDIPAFVKQILHYLEHPGDWQETSQNGLSLAKRFTYENYLRDVRALFENRLEKRANEQAPSSH